MTSTTPVGLAGYVRDQLAPPLATVGGFARMCVLTGKALFRPPFHWDEFIVQTWFITRVALLPTIAVAIPLTVFTQHLAGRLRGSRHFEFCRRSRADPDEPLGTNPWYGNPNQMRNCPAPGAHCDQPVDPGRVIPAPSINNGMNPLPADRLPPPPAPVNDALQRPGSGSVRCNGQQPNPCVYTPAGPGAVYLPSSGEVVGPDGAKYSLEDSRHTGDNGWKNMLAPAG